ncbi:hypothetical protein B0H16DRAFT_1741259 [Mycena metata]|uniref:Uncharacterized protein n=1 Tax=Mycena metata TaxID=1033252 RepID=A0AAD7HB35_9AGAR|nr:hypothetical protein B0H16DRAFT_1741259 [Mycena metata]
MADRLDEACHLSTHSLEGPSPTVIADSVTGKRGRPKKNINPAFLEEALTLRGPTGLWGVLRCHPRTIRRRPLELGLAAPVFPSTTRKYFLMVAAIARIPVHRDLQHPPLQMSSLMPQSLKFSMFFLPSAAT